MTDIAAGAAAPSDLFAATRVGQTYAWSPKAKSLLGLSGWLKGTLWLFIVGQIINIGLFGAMMWSFYVWKLDEGVDDPRAAVVAFVAGTAAQLAPYVLIGVFVLCVFFYLRFVYCASKNLALSHAQGLSFSPAWAAGSSLVPFLSLVTIVVVMKQIWKASADPEKNKIAAPMALGWWWGLWIAGGVVGRISDAMIPADAGADPTTFFDQFAPGASVALLASAIAIISTLLLLSIVKQITQAQEKLRSAAALSN